MMSILNNRTNYPTIVSSFEMTTAFQLILVVLGEIQEILSDGHTRLYNVIRDIIIRKWGKKFVGLSSKTFKLTERRICQILADKGDVEQKMTDILDGKHRQYRTGKEDPSFWINKLNDVLVKKSGEKSETLRSRWGKMELYELFVKGWYAESLDKQIIADSSLIDKAIDAKKPTRFQTNILTLLDYKRAKNIRAVEWNPEKDLPIPGLKFVSFETFFTTLANRGLKLHIDWAPHNCPLCRQIPIVNETIRTLRSGELKSENVEADLNVWTKKREGIYLHESQLHNQRGEVEKIRQKLDYHQALVISDFAGHYSTNNSKFYQLIFVILQR